MENKEYRKRLEILLSFFECASANKDIKTIKVEGTGFLDDAELIIDLIEKELKRLNKEKYVADNNVGNKKTNFEKLLENDKEQIIKLIAEECCIDTNKHKINKTLKCENCIFGKECISESKEWLESEVEDGK